MTTATADEIVSTEPTDDTTPRSRDRLTDAVRNLATRASRADADRALRIAGPVLLPTGAIVILLGWYGAANTTRVFLQIPYLISGGLLGLGLMFAGGFLYFARWLTDLLDESRRQASAAQETSERTALALERIESLLRERELLAPSEQGDNAPTGVVASATTGLVSTAKGTMAHRPDCRLVQGREVRPASADESLGRCQICRPPVS